MGKKGRHFPLKVMLQNKIFERTLKKAQETITKWAPEIAKVRSKKHKRPAQNEHQKSPSFVQKSTRDQHKMSTRNRQVSFKKNTRDQHKTSTRNRQVSFKKAQETSAKWAPEIVKFRSKKHKRTAQNEHQKSPSFVQKSTRDQHKTSTRNRQVSFKKAQETSTKWAPEIVKFRFQKSTRDQHKTSTRNRQVSLKKAQETSTKRAPEIAKFRSKKHKRPAQNERQKSPSIVQKSTRDQRKTSTRNRQVSFKKAQETSTKRAPEIAKFRSKKHKRPAQNERRNRQVSFKKAQETSTKWAPESAKIFRNYWNHKKRWKMKEILTEPESEEQGKWTESSRRAAPGSQPRAAKRKGKMNRK